MRKLETRLLDVRIEVVTATFVASGQLEGVRDIARFAAVLNDRDASPPPPPPQAWPAPPPPRRMGPRQIELHNPAVRPLYRATSLLHLEAPLLVARHEIVFANFEGPYVTAATGPYAAVDAPALLLAPPFQIQGIVALVPGIDQTQALRTATQGFFAVRRASVYDADGNILGEGDQIIVNGGILQMACVTKQHIDAAPRPAPVTEDEADGVSDLLKRTAA